MTDQEIRAKIIEWGARAQNVFRESKPEALSPKEVTNIQAMLAGYAGVIEEEYAGLEMIEPIFKSGLGFQLSEAQRNRVWAVTPEGQRQIQLKYLLKSLDRIIASCKRLMDRYKHESFNNS